MHFKLWFQGKIQFQTNLHTNQKQKQKSNDNSISSYDQSRNEMKPKFFYRETKSLSRIRFDAAEIVFPNENLEEKWSKSYRSDQKKHMH